MTSIIRDSRLRRRRPDSLASRILVRLRSRGLIDPSDAVMVGRLLLIGLGGLSLVTAALLHPGLRAWEHFGVISAVMVGVLGASFVVPWERLHSRVLLAFPLLGLLAFAGLGYGSHGMFAPMGGFATLCFVYVGLTQPPRTSVLVAPFSGLALVASYGELNSQVGIRLVVATSVQIILAEVLAGFVARHAQLTAALQSAAFSDALTGVPNRRDFDTHLAAARPGTVVIMCDLDHFKQLNDTHGHHAGDVVLADFGRLLRTGLRGWDYCARTGGEEFVLLLSDTSEEGGVLVLGRLRARWRLMRPETTFSAGIAVCRDDRLPDATLVAADEALYRAKQAGRDAFRLEEVSVPVGAPDR